MQTGSYSTNSWWVLVYPSRWYGISGGVDTPMGWVRPGPLGPLASAKFDYDRAHTTIVMQKFNVSVAVQGRQWPKGMAWLAMAMVFNEFNYESCQYVQSTINLII